jgi:Zn-dependent M28 family amino/carboxypeptidase
MPPAIQDEEPMPRRARNLAGLTVLLVLLAGSAPPPNRPLQSALDTITAEGILKHVKILASDEFEGRGPGTPGEDKTVDYLISQLRAIGLEPGNPDGTFVQKVPLTGFQATRVQAGFQAGTQSIPLEFPKNFVAVPGRAGLEPRLDDSQVVFVGYGAVAPEYDWDDFKGVDVRGKTLLMLVGDPPVPDPKDPAKLDPALFKGRAMTYYGRWTYKYEIAAKRGAAAAILVHEDGPAGYPFSVVQGSWSRENFDIADAPGKTDEPRIAVKGWIDTPTAVRLCQASGLDLANLKKAAIRRDFHPVPTSARFSARIDVKSRSVVSRNVIARLPGLGGCGGAQRHHRDDPGRRSGASKTPPQPPEALHDQHVIYTAHWDHLGRDPQLQGDQIYNGAADNASGVAAVLEIARALAKVDPPGRRSFLFLFVTAEEKGLLGSKYYASNPLYPLNRTLADINLDVINLWGKTSDLISVGMGQSTLDDLLVEMASARGRTVGPDAEPEKGFYYRSDHFEFAKQGVPALDPKGGRHCLDKPADYVQRKQDEYTQKNYHKVSDDVRPDWDLSGAVEDLKVILEVGYRIASADKFPEWKPDSEFRARREAAMKAAYP